jgi:hypothetical protein
MTFLLVSPPRLTALARSPQPVARIAQRTSQTLHGKNRLSHAYYGMANGQVVLLTTEQLGGSPPMRTVYYVAEEDPTKAHAIIAKIMAPNEKVEAYGLLPEAAVKALGLKPGEFRSA